jgi:hypothetical protein
MTAVHTIELFLKINGYIDVTWVTEKQSVWGLFKNVQRQGARGLRSEAYFARTPQRRRTKRNAAYERFLTAPDAPLGLFGNIQIITLKIVDDYKR